MKRRYLFVYPWREPATSPTLNSLAQVLATRGDDLEVLSPDGWHRVCGQAPGARQWTSLPAGRLTPLGRSRRVETRLYGVATQLALRAMRGRYHAVLGADATGIVLAERLSRAMDCPLVYVSFELMFADELVESERPLKRREVEASRRAALCVVQDPARGELLARENGLDPARLVMVPNAPLPVPVPASRWLREQLAIPESQRIVLYAGALLPWHARDLLLEMAHGWPDRFVLVLHSKHESHSRSRAWLLGLAESGRIRFTDGPVPAEDLAGLCASADFGLIPYLVTPDAWGTGKNVRHVGRASGKLAYFAMCGRPVLASRLPLLEEDLATHGGGMCFERIGESAAALVAMDARYEHFCKGARAYYDACLDPTSSLTELCDRLDSLQR